MKFIKTYESFDDDSDTMARYQLFNNDTTMSFYFNNEHITDPRFINHLIEKEPWLKNPELKILESSAGEGVLVDRFFELTGNKMDIVTGKQIGRAHV